MVRVTYLCNTQQGVDKTPPIVELYSVQEQNWRSVCADYVIDICISDFWWSQCFLNGAVHWVAWQRDSKTLVFDRNCLLLFDVEKERFKKIKLPHVLDKELNLNLCVSEYCGKLSLMDSVLKGGILGNGMSHCDIWVKGEYNVGSSWCKLVSIDLNSRLGLSWVQCLRKNGHVLGFNKEGDLFSYDPVMKQIKRVGLSGLWHSWFTCSYTESLILLDNKNGFGSYGEAGQRMKK